MIVGSLIPFFIHSTWYFILFCRAILGIGVGCATLGNPLRMRTVSKQELAKYIGLGSVMGSIANMIVNPIVGALCHKGWQYSFLANIIFIVIFIMVILFLQEPKHIEETKEKKTKVSLPTTVYLFILCHFVAALVLYPLLSGISNYLNGIGIDNSTVAGYMLSIYTGGRYCFESIFT